MFITLSNSECVLSGALLVSFPGAELGSGFRKHCDPQPVCFGLTVTLQEYSSVAVKANLTRRHLKIYSRLSVVIEAETSLRLAEWSLQHL